MRISPTSVAASLVALYLVSDIGLLAVNVATIDPADGARRLARSLWIGREWTVPELLQVSKWTICAIVLVLAHRVTRAPLHAVWAAVFAALAADDALSLHEATGIGLATVIPLRAGYLELVPMLAAAALILGSVRHAGSRTEDEGIMRFSRRTVVLVILYGAFTLGVDALHALAVNEWSVPPLSRTTLLLVEDGGEMLAATALLLSTTWHVAKRLRAAAPPHVTGVRTSV
jgi:hypothetical protein